MWGASRFLDPVFVIDGLGIAVALALAALGGAISVSGFLTFQREGANFDPVRIDKGEVLVTGGVYRFSRNPMYLGWALVLLSFSIYLARPAEALGPIFFVAFMTRFQILPEEHAMLAEFDARYEAYWRATRRWV